MCVCVCVCVCLIYEIEVFLTMKFCTKNMPITAIHYHQFSLKPFKPYAGQSQGHYLKSLSGTYLSN